MGRLIGNMSITGSPVQLVELMDKGVSCASIKNVAHFAIIPNVKVNTKRKQSTTILNILNPFVWYMVCICVWHGKVSQGN